MYMLVIVTFMNLTIITCIMYKNEKIILGISILLLITFIMAIIVFIPYLHSFMTWVVEIILVSWSIISIIFIMIFKKFCNK